MFRKNNKKQQWQNVKKNQNQNHLQQRSRNNLLHQVWAKTNQHLVQTLCKPTQVAVSYLKASNSFVLYSSHTVLYNIYAILHFIISACYIISVFKIVALYFLYICINKFQTTRVKSWVKNIKSYATTQVHSPGEGREALWQIIQIFRLQM